MKFRALFCCVLIVDLVPSIGLAEIRCAQIYKSSSIPRIFVDSLDQTSHAVAALQATRFEEALQFAILLVKTNPRNPDNLRMAGKALEGLGRNAEATLFFEKAAENTLSPYPDLMTLVRLYNKSRNDEGLIRAINQILEIDGDTGIGLNTLLGAQIRLGQLEAAQKTLVRLEKVEENPHFLISAQVKLDYAKGEYEQIVKKVDQFAETNPELVDGPIYGLKAQAQTQMGQIRRATQTYLTLLKIEPDNVIALSQGAHLLILQGKFAGALPLLRKVHELEPGNPVTFWNRVISLLALGRIDVLEQTQATMKGSYFKNMVDAAIFIAKGEYQRAVDALDAVPLESRAPKTLILQLKAQAQYEMGRIDQAYMSLMQIIKIARKVNYSAIAALIKIERMDTPMNKFEPSPALKAILASLTPRELEMVVKTSLGNVWAYETQVPAIEADPAYSNSFWGRTNNIPVNGAAVKELKTND